MADRQYIVLADSQLAKPPPTPKSLMLDATLTSAMTKLIAEFEVRSQAKQRLFQHPFVENSFNNIITEQMENPEDVFNVTAWYLSHCKPAQPVTDIFVPAAAAAARELQVDWVSVLMQIELQYNGFIVLLTNHLKMDRELNSSIEQANCTANQAQWAHRTPAPVVAAGYTKFSGETAVRSNLF
jgi:hypothetical protein